MFELEKEFLNEEVEELQEAVSSFNKKEKNQDQEKKTSKISDDLKDLFVKRHKKNVIFCPFPFKDDGSVNYKIIYCEKCGEPLNKLLKFPKDDVLASGKKFSDMRDSDFSDKVMLVRNFCACTRDEEQARERNQTNEIRQEFKNKVQDNKNKCFDSNFYLNFNFTKDKKYDKEVSDYTHRYVDKFNIQSKGIVYLGNVGIGKTFYACCVANELLDKGLKVYFNQIPKMVNTLTKEFGKYQDQFLKYIRDVDLLIIDDFGIERISEYMYENIYLIINERYISGKPLIITTNLSLEQYNHEANKFNRIHSRIKEMCVTKFFNLERDLRSQ